MSTFTDVLIIVVGVMIAEIIYDLIKTWRNRNIASIFCDGCKKPRKTRRSHDRKFWLCARCRKIYREENQP